MRLGGWQGPGGAASQAGRKLAREAPPAAEPGGRWIQIWDGLYDEFLQAREMGLLRPPKRGRLGREEQVDSEVEQRAQLRAELLEEITMKGSEAFLAARQQQDQ